LVIDDNQAIHQDFRKIFGPGPRSSPSLDSAESVLFGPSSQPKQRPAFQIDSAFQGQEGLAMVRRALEEHLPYMMAFVDVRMPPGWDGVETTAKIWEQDPDLQVVICTAYSDYSLEEMLEELGHSDRLVILKKPFDNIEVQQLANALTEKWQLLQRAKSKMDDLERAVADRTRELKAANEELGRDISERKRAEKALRDSETRYRRLFDCNPSPLFVLDDEDLTVLGVNKAAVSHYGYSREEFCSMTISQIQAGESPAPEGQAQPASRPNFYSSGLCRHQKKDGTVIDIEATSHSLVFDEKQVQILAAIDVTERLRMDQLERQAAELQRALLEETECALREVGRFQQQMQAPNRKSIPANITLCLHPKHQAGGDFINVYRISPKHSLLLAADVSGHDLKAAYISSYFQGIVRGMIEKCAAPQQILEFFNRFLLSEWNSLGEKFSLKNDTQTSICVCCALLDQDNQIISLTNNGFPAPLFIGSEGNITLLGETTGPLGWFEDQCPQEIDLPGDQDGSLFIWSDGMEDYARRHSIAPCAVAYRLLHPAADGEEANFLADIADDISLARLRCGGKEVSRDEFQPVFAGSYAGDEAIKIDGFQADWEKSLLFALPNLSASQLYDPLLCSREALLNALVHGCGTEPTRSSVMQISYHPSKAILRVRVEDPGSGYDQPLEIDQDSLSQHCGLKLLKTLPDRLTVSRGGAALTMDFNLGERKVITTHRTSHETHT